jgi:LysM repeat protein
MHRFILTILVIFALTACGSDDTPAPTTQATNQSATALSQTNTTKTPTSVPTVSLPTAGPTSTPAPPTATATLTTDPTATDTPMTYAVKAGDTLLAIAIAFDTTTEAIATANGIDEENFLQLGQPLIIPPTPTSTATVNAAAGTDNSPTVGQPATGSAAGQPAPEGGNTTETEPVNNSPGGANGAEAAPAPPPAPVFNLPVPPVVNHGPNVNPLTGLPVSDPSVLTRRPIMVRIGNDVGARASQIGLNRADMVYEEITEWWVTRYTAIFLSDLPNMVAPVRSARLINVQLVPQYKGALASSGGSDGVRWEISQSPIANLDEYYHPSPYFYRENQGWQTRLAFDVVTARSYMAQQGLDATVSQAGFKFAPEITTGEPAPNIFIPYPRATSFTQWIYSPTTGLYQRWINDSPLVDAGDGQQISAANVIVYFAEHQETDIVEDSNGATAIRIQMNGTGPAWFFRDGKLNRGYWQSDGTHTPYFALEDGTPYPLKPGNTWVEVVPSYFSIGINSPDETN